MRQTQVWISIVMACLLLIQQATTAPTPEICGTASHPQAPVTGDKGGASAEPVHSHHHHEHAAQTEEVKCQKCGKIDCGGCVNGDCMDCHSSITSMVLASLFGAIQVDPFREKTPYTTHWPSRISNHPYRPPISI